MNIEKSSSILLGFFKVRSMVITPRGVDSRVDGFPPSFAPPEKRRRKTFHP